MDVLAIFSVVVVLGTVSTLLQKPVFEASVALEINARPRDMVPGSQVVQMGANEYGYFAAERYFNTQFQIIRSRAVVSRVMEELDLFHHPAFAEVDDPVEAFSGRMTIDPVQETGVAHLKVRAGTAEEAALWANTLAEVYVQRNLDQAVGSTEQAVNALVQRLQPLKAELLKRERKRLEFAGEQSLYAEDPQRSFQARLTLLENDLTETEVKRLELQAVVNKVAEIERGEGDHLLIPRIASDVTIQGLIQERNTLETGLRKLLVMYKPGHFRAKEQETELAKVRQKITSEAQRIMAAIRTEHSLLLSRANELEAAIEETKQAALAYGRKASEYEVYQSESSEARKVYDLISARIESVRLSTELLRNNVGIIDEAIVPSGPVSPKRRLNVALSIVVGLVLGIGTVFFLDYVDNTVKTSEDIEKDPGMSILAIVPRKSEASEVVIKESFQSLRTNLNFSSLNRARRLILMTSAGPQEGKTSTIVALARTQAAAGDKVVLIDCDLRRPNVHNHLKIKRNFGLTNYLADGSEESSWHNLKSTDTPNLSVMTCGPIPPNPPELFGTDRFRRLLDGLKEEFDWVLLDSPPVASLTDSMILASMADMVTFVIRHRENDRELIRRLVESIRSVNQHVVGAILNDVDLGRSHYRDYYYAGYYYYGSSDSTEKADPRKKFRGRRKVG